MTKLHDLPHYKMEGIPEDNCYIKRQSEPTDDGTIVFYLIARKDNVLDKISYTPVIYAKEASEKTIKDEYERAEKRLLALYNKLG